MAYSSQVELIVAGLRLLHCLDEQLGDEVLCQGDLGFAITDFRNSMKRVMPMIIAPNIQIKDS